MKILIVDDSPVAIKILRSCLPADRSFEIVEARDGKSGVEKFVAERPDLTFTDITMPVMDGIHALEHMKKIRPEAPIVVCSADVQPKTIERVMELGAFDMVRKPATREQLSILFRKVDDWMRGGGSA
ncbi:MAG: response regulator [Thermodesulfobacteriota bacterium]